MQSGFALLEVGYVSSKNVANILVKNVLDVCLGGIMYWALGYGLSFGTPSMWFTGLSSFLATPTDPTQVGSFYSSFVYHLSFAVSSATIVSGAVAERMRLSAYNVFSALHTFTYCFPASWVWGNQGFLKQLGFHDFSGGVVVHMGGGASALVAAFMLGPRTGRFDPRQRSKFKMNSPFSALTGSLMLWWAWLSFNSGSSMGVQRGKWRTAAKASMNTLCGSMAGCTTAMFISLATTRWKLYKVDYLITGLLAGLVSINSGCDLYYPAEAFLMGSLGALAALATGWVLEKVEIDDPVGAVPVHCTPAILGALGVAVFGVDDTDHLNGHRGIVHGGSWVNLGVQFAGVGALFFWNVLTTAVFMKLIDLAIGVRMSLEDEERGADASEHAIELEEVTMGVSDEQGYDSLGVPHKVVIQTLRLNESTGVLHPKSLISCDKYKQKQISNYNLALAHTNELQML